MRGHWTRQSPVPLLSTPLHIVHLVPYTSLYHTRYGRSVPSWLHVLRPAGSAAGPATAALVAAGSAAFAAAISAPSCSTVWLRIDLWQPVCYAVSRSARLSRVRSPYPPSVAEPEWRLRAVWLPVLRAPGQPNSHPADASHSGDLFHGQWQWPDERLLSRVTRQCHGSALLLAEPVRHVVFHDVSFINLDLHAA